MANLGQCLRAALGQGWAVRASAFGSSHTLSRAVLPWAQWVRRRRLGPACWNWMMTALWTRPWAAAWAQASRTLAGRGGARRGGVGGREEAIRAGPELHRGLQGALLCPHRCSAGGDLAKPCACAPPPPSLFGRNQVKMGTGSSRVSHDGDRHPV